MRVNIIVRRLNWQIQTDYKLLQYRRPNVGDIRMKLKTIMPANH